VSVIIVDFQILVNPKFLFFKVVTHLTELIHPKDNANVYIDYENIWALLQRYGTDPMAINFFPVILDRLKKDNNLNIIDCIAYCNFERKSFNGRLKTAIQQFGIQTRHSANGTKNCSDLLLTVDALLALSKSPHIKVFVIISSDRDMISLLNAIKADNKLACLISTRLGFNTVMAEYANHHEYLEDIFNLSLPWDNEEREYISDAARAREASRLLFRSKVWQNYEKTGHPVTLKGYVIIIAQVVKRTPSQIIEDFKLADFLKYVKLYEDPRRGLCFNKGDKYAEVFEK
jgi:hypothetical protein